MSLSVSQHRGGQFTSDSPFAATSETVGFVHICADTISFAMAGRAWPEHQPGDPEEDSRRRVAHSREVEAGRPQELQVVEALQAKLLEALWVKRFAFINIDFATSIDGRFIYVDLLRALCESRTMRGLKFISCRNYGVGNVVFDLVEQCNHLGTLAFRGYTTSSGKDPREWIVRHVTEFAFLLRFEYEGAFPLDPGARARLEGSRKWVEFKTGRAPKL